MANLQPTTEGSRAGHAESARVSDEQARRLRRLQRRLRLALTDLDASLGGLSIRMDGTQLVIDAGATKELDQLVRVIEDRARSASSDGATSFSPSAIPDVPPPPSSRPSGHRWPWAG